MRLKLPARKRLFRWLAGLLLVVISLLYLVLPAAVGMIATLHKGSEVGAPPDGFQELTLTTSDGVELAAWYAEPQNGAVIIVLHGAGSSRNGIRSYAEMLLDNGFGVLAFDLRGSGESEGQTNRFGWNGSRDVGAAMAYLLEHPEVEVIGGLGVSLGGEVLLGAVSDHPDLRAVASDGATFRSVAEYIDLPANRPLYRNFTIRVLYLSVGLFSGDNPPKPLLDSIVDAEATALLFIAAGENKTEVEYNEMFAATAGDRAFLWVVPEVGHTGGFNRYPALYEQQVIAFFEKSLLQGD